MARTASHRLPASRLFRPRSMQDLLRCDRMRCAPTREEPLLQPEKTQNCDALTVRSNRIESVHFSRITLIVREIRSEKQRHGYRQSAILARETGIDLSRATG